MDELQKLHNQSPLSSMVSKMRWAASSFVICSSSISRSAVRIVIILVSPPNPAPAFRRLFAQIISQCFDCSFFREFSITFSVSIENPHKNRCSGLCSPSVFKMSVVRWNETVNVPSAFDFLRGGGNRCIIGNSCCLDDAIIFRCNG